MLRSLSTQLSSFCKFAIVFDTSRTLRTLVPLVSLVFYRCIRGPLCHSRLSYSSIVLVYRPRLSSSSIVLVTIVFCVRDCFPTSADSSFSSLELIVVLSPLSHYRIPPSDSTVLSRYLSIRYRTFAITPIHVLAFALRRTPSYLISRPYQVLSLVYLSIEGYQTTSHTI